MAFAAWRRRWSRAFSFRLIARQGGRRFDEAKRLPGQPGQGLRFGHRGGPEGRRASPDTVANRLLLVNPDVRRPARRAEAEATKAQCGASTAEIYAQRGYAENLQNFRGAMSDWETALQRGLPPDQARNVRLSLAELPSPQRIRCARCAPFRSAGELRHGDPQGLCPASARSQGRIHRRIPDCRAPGTTAVQRDEALRAQINTL